MDRAYENKVLLVLTYAQVQSILAAVYRVAGEPNPEGEEQRNMCDVFPQACELAASIRELAEAATEPLLDYLDRHKITPPTVAPAPAPGSVVLVELTVEECRRLGGAGTSAVQTWDLFLRGVPSWLVKLTPAHQWRAEAVEAVADWLAACRLAGVPTEISK